MKKLVFSIVAIFCLIPAFLQAQIYQLPNPGFEQWDGAGDAEPTYWNSFATSECTLPIGCASAQTTHHENSSDARPGSAGSHSCRIWSTSIMGVVANGNMTTGRIHAGSISAANAANYNVTYPTQAGFNQPFNGKPDYMKFWAKLHAASSSTQARMNTIVHSNAAVRDPVISNDYPYIAGVSTLNFSGDNTWHEYTVPFSYSYGNANAEYVLITFSTNMNPGGGSANDELYIDDIEFVYISTLSSLKSNGTSVPNFSANTLNYSIELPYGSSMPNVTATATSVNGVVSITQPTVANPTATIVVTQGPSTTTYTISYTFAARESADLLDIQLDSISLDNYNVNVPFSPNTLVYNVRLPFGSSYPVVTATLDVPTAQLTITQPTEENPVATLAVTCGALAKTYTLNFAIAPENTAELSDLLLDGVTIAGFDPDITDYRQMLTFGAPIPTVSAVALSPDAVVTVTQATQDAPVATVEVVCGPLSKTYTVQFTIASLFCPQLLALNVNGAQIPDFNSNVYDYTYELPFGYSLANVTVSAVPISPIAVVGPIIVDTVTVLNITCGDSAATYSITFEFAAEQTADLSDLRIDGITISNFDPAVTSYNVVVFSEEFPEVTATPRSADGIATITQATAEQPDATVLVSCNGLSKVYTVHFIVEEANADLADLLLNELTISDFNPDTVDYIYRMYSNLPMPTITAVAASEYAQVVITQPTTETMLGTVEVTCGNLVKTYSVHIQYNDAISQFTLNSVCIYPNPVSDVLNVAIDASIAGAEVVLMSVAGQQVLSAQLVDGVAEINMANLRGGVYLVRIQSGSQVLGVRKVVKL